MRLFPLLIEIIKLHLRTRAHEQRYLMQLSIDRNRLPTVK